jgi:hypothetical protein
MQRSIIRAARLAAATLVALLPALPAAAAAGSEATGEARKSAEALFNRYVDLEHAFDPALVNLYAGTAHIESRVIVNGRPPTVRTWDGNQYKELLRRALAKAKESKKDYNYYTGMTYLREGSRVRIKASRYAEMQKAVSPVELLVGPDRDGSWKIFEELSESHPVTFAPPKK